MAERIIKTNQAELCTEAFGDASDPALLLIMGATASMVWWPDAFCKMLATRGRYVIRYDNRDTGKSTTDEPGSPGYSLDDMTDDAMAVLDAYGLRSAHFVGMSLGGMIAQIAALAYPGRVASLTLIASSVFGRDDPSLPGIDRKVLVHHASGRTVNWDNEREAVDFIANGWRLLSGSANLFNEPLIRGIANTEFRRARSLPSMFNHALLQGGERWYGRIGEISQPTLVIHGTDDPVLPYPHGLALTRTIPGADLLTLDGTGHELHPNNWAAMTEAIVRHTG